MADNSPQESTAAQPSNKVAPSMELAQIVSKQTVSQTKLTLPNDLAVKNANVGKAEDVTPFQSFSDDLSQQINNLDQSNPFDKMVKNIAESHKLTHSASADSLNLTRSDQTPSVSNVTRPLKRPRNNSGSPTIESSDTIIIPIKNNEGLKSTQVTTTKKVTFSLQSNDGTPDAPAAPDTPEKNSWQLTEQESNLIDKNNPIWGYNISTHAYESWKVALNARRNEAKLQIRIHYLKSQITDKKLPAWAYGLLPCPEYINPLPTKAIEGAHNRANDIAKLCLMDLEDRMQSEKRKADKFTKTTAELYTEVNDPNYVQAETRMVAMITQARKREHELHKKQPDIILPSNPEDIEWASLLPRRSHVTGRDSNSRSRSNSNERSRSNSPKRQQGNRGGPNNRRGRGPRGNNTNRGRGRGKQSSYNNPQYNNYGGNNYAGNSYQENYSPESRGNYRGRGGKPFNNNNQPRYTKLSRNQEEDIFLQGFRAAKSSRN